MKCIRNDFSIQLTKCLNDFVYQTIDDERKIFRGGTITLDKCKWRFLLGAICFVAACPSANISLFRC